MGKAMYFKYWTCHNKSMILIARFKHVCRYARALEKIIEIQKETIDNIRKEIVFDMHLYEIIDKNEEDTGTLLYRISEKKIFDNVMLDYQDYDERPQHGNS